MREYILDALKATLAVAVLFGLPLSEAQLAGVVLALAAWSLVLQGLADRRRRKAQP